MGSPQVKLFVTDLDGTLLTSGRHPHEGGSQALRELTEAGIVVCLASGRALHTMRPIAAQIGLHGPTVSSNGALVLASDSTVVHDARVPAHMAQYLVDYARNADVHVNLYCGDTILATKDGWESDLYQARTGCSPLPFLQNAAVSVEPQKVLFVAEPHHLVHHRAALLDWAAECRLSVVVSEPDYLEFLPPGVDKGSGLERLARHMGIHRGQVAAIGDWTNDTHMLEWAGHSAAVANAHPDVIRVAQRVVASNDDGGVEEFARSFLYVSGQV